MLITKKLENPKLAAEYLDRRLTGTGVSQASDSAFSNFSPKTFNSKSPFDKDNMALTPVVSERDMVLTPVTIEQNDVILENAAIPKVETLHEKRSASQSPHFGSLKQDCEDLPLAGDHIDLLFASFPHGQGQELASSPNPDSGRDIEPLSYIQRRI